jgi:hypothetical protein
MSSDERQAKGEGDRNVGNETCSGDVHENIGEHAWKFKKYNMLRGCV